MSEKYIFTDVEKEEISKRIEAGDELLNKVACAYNYATTERASMKVIIRQLLRWSEEEGLNIPYEKWDEIINNAHDDDTFFTEMLSWFVDHMNDFGENYGLEFDKE